MTRASKHWHIRAKNHPIKSATLKALISAYPKQCSNIWRLQMPANFTSGWLGNNQAAWHGQGVVTEGTLPAREAFETADALFAVEKRELYYVNDDACHNKEVPLWFPSESFAVVRTDTQALLGVVSRQYEIVQNDSLLRMAEFIREEVDMDCVIVLSDGAKVCFTATLRGAETDIVPGDTVKTSHCRLLRTRRQDWMWCQVHQHPCCLSKHIDCCSQ